MRVPGLFQWSPPPFTPHYGFDVKGFPQAYVLEHLVGLKLVALSGDIVGLLEQCLVSRSVLLERVGLGIACHFCFGLSSLPHDPPRC